MKIQFYSTPDGVKTWNQCYLGGIMTFTSFSCNPKFVGYGKFELVMPYNERWLGVLDLNYLVEVCVNGSGNYADWYIIQSIEFDTKNIIISGYDLNYLLTLRSSVYVNNNTQDYDPVSGTTAQCIQHYLDSNMINPANENRRIPLSFSANGVAGKTNDVYLAKLKPINEIVDDLCTGAEIGYVIKGSSGASVAKLSFSLLQGTDRSVTQNVNSPVILGTSKRNIKSIKFVRDCADEVNCIWATGAGATMAVFRDVTNIPKGIERRECAVDVDVQSVSDVSDYALYEVRDNVRADNYTVEPDSGTFGTMYKLGDVISVRDDVQKIFYNAAVTQASVSYTPGHKNVSITVGKPKMKLLDGIVNNVKNGTAKSSG